MYPTTSLSVRNESKIRRVLKDSLIQRKLSPLILAIGLLFGCDNNNPSESPSNSDNPTVSDTPSAPTPAVPTQSQPIEGFTNVTLPIKAVATANQYDIGGGNQFGVELSDVPWQDLQAGDVVNIYHRTTPYRHKILLSEQGTAENPIVVNGVTNSVGIRPTIHADNAVTVNPDEWNDGYRSALIMINRRNNTGTYGENAKHYRIQNLRLTGARATSSYTHNSINYDYVDGARAIWSAGGQYITLQGMIIEDNGSGVFIQANDDPGSLSKTWTIRGSKFENNGSGNRDHQVYFQAVSDAGEFNIVEGNYFGAPTPDQSSIAQLKMRSTGVIVRYNWFNSAHRTLDLVEAQDAIPDWMYQNYTPQQILENYRTSYIYGNIFVMDEAASSGQLSTRPLHFGADSFDADALFNTSGSANGEPGMRGYESPTYFYHNSFYMHTAQYRGDLFDLENNNSNGPTPTPGSVDAWNNIFEFAGNSRIGAMNRSGTVNLNGSNLLYTDTLTIFAESDAYANFENSADDPDTTLNYNGDLVTQSARFVDDSNVQLGMKDFSLQSDSPAIGRAAELPPELLAFPVTLQSAGNSGGAVNRNATSDLGALEYSP